MRQNSIFNCNNFDPVNLDNIYDDDSHNLPYDIFGVYNLCENTIKYNNDNDTVIDIEKNKSNKGKNQKQLNFTDNIIKDKDDPNKIGNTYLKETVKSTNDKNKIKSIKTNEKNKIKINNNKKRKAIKLLINTFIKDINNIIKKVYNNNIGNGINEN